MNTAKYNLSIQSGETYSKQFKLVGANGVPFDLTDYTLSSVIKDDYANVSASAIFSVPVLDAANGIFNLLLAPVSSSLLTGSCYYYDIKLQKDDIVLYPLEGKVTVSPSVTR